MDNFEAAELVDSEKAAAFGGHDPSLTALSAERQLVAWRSHELWRRAYRGRSRASRWAEGEAERAAPTLRKVLDHLSLTAWVMSRKRGVEIVPSGGGRPLGFQLAASPTIFSVLDQVWRDIRPPARQRWMVASFR